MKNLVVKTEYDVTSNENKILLDELSQLNKNEKINVVYNDNDLRGYLPFLDKIKELNGSGYNLSPFISINLSNNNSLLIKNHNGLIECLNVLNRREFTDKNQALKNLYLDKITDLMMVETSNIKNLSLETFTEPNFLLNINLNNLGNFMPILNNPSKQHLLNVDNLRKHLFSKLDEKNISPELFDVYKEKINYELSIFNKGTVLNKDFIPYMLLMSDIAQSAKDSGIALGKARGSSAGSIVAYLLDINNVDPVQYNLSSDRFLNPTRSNLVDIDLDIQADKVDNVISNIKEMGYFVASVRTYNSHSFNDFISNIKNTSWYNENIDIWDKVLDDAKKIIEKNKLDIKHGNVLYSQIFNSFKNIMNDNLDNKYFEKANILLDTYKKIKYGFNQGNSINNIIRALQLNEANNIYIKIISNQLIELAKNQEITKDANQLHNSIISILDKAINTSLQLAYKSELQSINIEAKRLKSYKNLSKNAASKIILNKSQLKEVSKLVQVDHENGEFVISANKEIVEKVGFVKFDLLALANLTITSECKKSIGNINVPISKHELELPENKDKIIKAINFMADNELSSIFQMNSNIMKIAAKKVAQDLRDNNYQGDIINNISNLIAIIRPGTLKNNAALSYLKNQNTAFISEFKGCENGENSHKTAHFNSQLINILKPTRQNLIYQEQIMEICQLVGFSGVEADNFRRAISKKDPRLIENCKSKFLELSAKYIDSNIPNDKKYFDSLFDKMKNLAEYSFNKSHSISYAMQVWENIYLASNHPKEFIEASIKVISGNIDGTNKSPDFQSKINQLSYLAGELGYKVTFDNNSTTSIKESDKTLVIGNDIIKSSFIFSNIGDLSKFNKTKLLESSIFNSNTLGLINYGNNEKSFIHLNNFTSFGANSLRPYINTLKDKSIIVNMPVEQISVKNDGLLHSCKTKDNEWIHVKTDGIINEGENLIKIASNNNLFDLISINNNINNIYSEFINNGEKQDLKNEINKISDVYNGKIDTPDFWSLF